MKKSETCLNKNSLKNNKNLPLLILAVVFLIAYFLTTFFDIYDLGYWGYSDGYNLFQELRSSATELHYNDVDGYYYSYNFSYSQTSLCEVVFGGLFALIGFDFLLNKSKLYTHLAFAKSKKSVYISKTVIPFISAGIIIVAVKLIAAIANGVYLGVTQNLIKGIIANTLTSLMIFAMGFTITVIAHIFTARRVETYTFIASALILPYAIETTVKSIFDAQLEGYVSDSYMFEAIPNEINNFFAYFNPTYYITDYSLSGAYIPVKGFVSFKDEYFIAIMWLVIFIGALILCGKYFSQKYKPENAGKKAISKIVTVISSISIPLFVIQPTNWFSFYNSINYEKLSVIMMVSGILVVTAVAVIISMLVTRSAKSSLWGAVGGGAAGLLQVVVFILAVTGCFGFTTRIPDKNDIEAIEVSLPFDDMISNTTEKFFFSDSLEYYDDVWVSENILITDDEDFDIIRNIHSSVLEKSDDKTSITFNVTYTLKNGGSINRQFSYISDNAAKEFIKVWETEPIQDGLKVLLNQDESADYKAYPQAQASSYSSSMANPYLYSESEDIWGSSSNVVFAIDPQNVFLASKDMQITSLSTVAKDAESLPDFSEERTLELMEAIYKDAQVLSAEEWFSPEKELGAIAFCDYSYNADNIATYEFFKLADAIFYINSNMKNTLAVLDKYNYTKYFECKKEVIAAHLVDVNDVVKWKRSLNESYLSDYPYYTQKGLHGTYFTQDYYEISGYIVNGCNYRNINIFSENGEVKEVFYPDELFPVSEDGYNMTTQEVITDLNFAKNLVKDAYMAYNVGNHGKFLVVKFADGTQAMLVVPEKNQ